MSYSTNCGCGGCGCTACQPANTVFNSTCTDPGAVNQGAALAVYDASFCHRRLANQAGLVVINLTPSGYQVKATTEPQVAFSTFSVASGGTVGSLLVQGLDQIIRTLLPPNTSGLYLSTNGVGQFVLAPLPTFSVPDPLTVTTATITNLTATNATVSGSVVFSGVTTGTAVATLGVDAGGNVVKSTGSTAGVQSSLYYEAPTIPSASNPNATTVPGSMLVIGNEVNSSLSSSGQLLSVNNSQTLEVVQAGFYLIDWTAYIAYADATVGGNPAVLLLINGVVVSNGNGYPSTDVVRMVRGANIAGTHQRRLNMGDTVQLQLAVSSNTGARARQVTLRATRIGA